MLPSRNCYKPTELVFRPLCGGQPRPSLVSSRYLPAPHERRSDPIPSFLATAILFDLDGVLVDSRGVVETVWRRWAGLRNVDPEPFIAVAHGRRSSETICLVAPELDARAEAAVLDEMEARETEGLAAIPGAARLLASLPGRRWGIVTSGSVPIATLRLRAVGIEPPELMVTGERVERGKPDPEGYLLGARLLGAEPAGCLVFEDATVGVEAARAAGMRVVAVATTHERAALQAADAIVDDLTRVGVATPDGELAVTVHP
ncbi:MAG: HAD family hydrolase [Gemmatimonadales bacterium]